MRPSHADKRDPVRRPLLDDAGIAALLAQGRRLAQATDASPSDAGRHGGSASPRPGSGLDFAEHRRYQAGDDVRRMDWRVTARTGQPHVRRYHEDLVPDTWLLVDRRAPMRFATHGRLKAAQALHLALLLAGLRGSRQSPVSAVSLDTGLHVLGPAGPAQLPGVGHQLAAPCPPLVGAGPSLGEALARLDRHAAAGSRVYLLSDLADADSVPDTLWQRLGRRHRVAAVLVTDPAETELPAAAGVSLCWTDDGGAHRLPMDGGLRERLQRQHRDHLTDLEDRLRRAGIALWPLATTHTDLAPLARKLDR